MSEFELKRRPATDNIFAAASLLDEKLSEEIRKKIAEGKHDGKLGGAEAYYNICDGINIVWDSGELASLDAKQALSLLAWLLQERPHLEELARDRHCSICDPLPCIHEKRGKAQ